VRPCAQDVTDGIIVTYLVLLLVLEQCPGTGD